MKNFFKKLAFVLALAMVLVSVAPATANAAAKAPSLKKTSKILYIGGDLTGTISDSYRFYFNNAAGYTSTWESLNEDVVVIEGKTVVAVGVGKAVVKATLTNKAGKEVVREATVWVKQNAEKVGFGSLKAVEAPIELGAKVKINVFRQVGDKKVWTQSDMATVTDKIVWSSSDEKVATVDKWGTVTAVGAGEATITATAVQPQGPTDGESASYKVTVVSGLTSAAQKNLNTVNLTFGTKVDKEKVNKTTVKLYEVVGTTKVAVLVNDVKIDEKDATKVELISFTNFKKNATYVVEYDGKTAEFVAVDPSVESVKEVKILTHEAVKGEATKVEYQLLTSNGVDVTSAIPSSRVTLEVKGNELWFNTSTNEVTFYDAGKVATAKAVFHTYTYADNGTENVVQTEATIVSVDKKVAGLGTVVEWSLEKSNSFDFKKGTPNKRFALSDGGLYFIGKFVDTNKKDVFTNADSKFTFESSNSNVFIVNTNTTTNETIVYPVNEGVATLIVKYDGVAVDAIAITVSPKRVPATINYTLSKAVVSQGTSDKIDISVVVTDNYQDPIAAKDVEVEVLSKENSNASLTIPTGLKTDSKGKVTITLNGTAFTTTNNSNAGAFNLKIKVGDIYRVVSVTAKLPGQTANVALNVTKGEIKTTLKVATGASINAATDFQSKIELNNVDNSGLYVGPATIEYGKQTKPSTGKVYYYEFYTPNGTEITDGKIDGVKFLENNVFSAVTTSGTAIKKAPVGDYRVAYYSIDDKGNVSALGQSFIKVRDEQPVAVLDHKRVASEASSVDGAFLNGDIVIKLNIDADDDLETLTSFVEKDLLGVGANGEESGRSILVKSVTYRANVTFGGQDCTYDIKINVGMNLILK